MVVQKNKTEYPESVVGIYTRIGADHSFPGDFLRVFEKGSRIISFMLGPTVVVLGYLLYEQIAQLKENAVLSLLRYLSVV